MGIIAQRRKGTGVEGLPGLKRLKVKADSLNETISRMEERMIPE